MTARLSVVIPAHNEGPLLREGLERMLADAAPGEFEVVVAANGCSDDTVAQAQAVPGVTVVEVAEASKIAALNAADRVADVFPRAYVDADVVMTTETLRALADTLADPDEALVAAPELIVDASQSTLPVRCHTRIWALSEYRRTGHVGSGVYAVSASGRTRWGRFPDVIADDRFVQLRFAPAERVTVAGETFTVRAPRTLRSLIRRGTRIERGNRELPKSGHASGSQRRLLERVLRTPALWTSFPFYAIGYAVPKLRVAVGGSRPVVWDRDESLREAART